MRKKILLTGGAGFIGANFVKKICCDKKVSSDFHFIISYFDPIEYGNFLLDIVNLLINKILAK